MSEKKTIELHAFIAEHVMKWRRVNFAISSKDSFCVRDEGVYIYAAPNTMVPFSPTTDRAAAMEVLEKCAEKTEQRKCMYLGKIENEWVVGIDDLDLKLEEISATLPLAICLFAKKIYEKD